MTENRTLGDFAGDDDGDDTEADDGPVDDATPAAPTETAAIAETDVRTDSTDTESATVTYAWSPTGDACDACGETADRRWRAGEGADDPDALVCPDCKEW